MHPCHVGPSIAPGGSRSRRVIVLLVGILLLSLADLFATLANLHSVGMVEANPVARFVIEHGESWGLAAYKLTTVAICLSLLFWLRHSLQGEIASWVGLAILIGLSLYWGHYSASEQHMETMSVQANGESPDDRWLTLADW